MRERLAELIAEASGGEITVADILKADCSLPALGVTSLAYLRLIDAIEEELGVDIDLDEDPERMDTLDGLVEYITERQARASS